MYEWLRENLPIAMFGISFAVLLMSFLAGYRTKIPETIFLNGEPQWVTLVDKVRLTSNTFRFRFQFTPPSYFGLPAGQHIRMYCPNRPGVKEGEWNGRPDGEANMSEVSRKYTPITPEAEARGYIDLIIKVYTPVPDKYPDGGKFSMYAASLELQDRVKMIGPVGQTIYLGDGQFEISGQKTVKHEVVGLIAGGSGITPILQVLYKSFQNETDHTRFYLIYANTTPEDIIERNFFDELAENHPNRFHVWYTVDSCEDKSWSYSTGFINMEMLQKHLPGPNENSIIGMCGPRPMILDTVKPLLGQLGWEPNKMVTF